LEKSPKYLTVIFGFLSYFLLITHLCLSHEPEKDTIPTFISRTDLKLDDIKFEVDTVKKHLQKINETKSQVSDSIQVFTVFRLLTDFVCLYNYEFGLSLCKIVRSSVILLLPLFTRCIALPACYISQFSHVSLLKLG
jgi:hypothetical protein